MKFNLLHVVVMKGGGREEEELERLGRIGRCCKLVRFFAVVLQVCFRFATARDSKGKCSLHP